MIHYMLAVDADRVLIIGPYETEQEAGEAGRQWQRQHNDNPSWMTARLPQGVRSVRFLQPTQRETRA